jgi:hemerythrin superfamily protein
MTSAINISKPAEGGVPDLSKETQYRDMNNIITIIQDEHQRVEVLYKAFQEAKDPDDRMILVYNMMKMLSVHAGCEELVVYPVFKDRIPGGEEIYKRSVEDHRQLKVDLYTLDGMTWKDQGFEQQVDKCMQDQIKHAREEEKLNLPLLAQHLPPEDLRKMAKDFMDAKAVAPTRPHPDAPVGSRMAYATAVALDAAKDAVRFTGVTMPKGG